LLAEGTDNPEINRLLGTEGNLGEMLGLKLTGLPTRSPPIGNYGEVFEANIGENTPIGLGARPERSVDRRWPALLAAVPLSRPGRGAVQTAPLLPSVKRDIEVIHAAA
jgi:hypothetical protein